ncbi:hypothetical protein CVN56_30630 [Rhodococcus sp. AQ5-07]|nr:hypothetical protein CVN56_30630 [Rhodococcus sp. AQ5-07]
MKSPVDRLWNALKRNWDLCVSAILATTFCITSILRGEKLDGVGPILIAGMAVGAAIGATTLVASRWVTDMLTKDEYGELIRMIDSSESNVRRPYEIVATAAFLTASLSILVFVIHRAISENFLILLMAMLLGIGMYSFLGSITLIRITRRHSARAARIRSLKERNARERRRNRPESGRDDGKPDPS